MLDLMIIFVLSAFIGYFVVWGVTPALYSPLMSVSNAISGVIILGAISAAGFAESKAVEVCALIAVVLAAINIFGGFAVSARMLAMFKTKEKK